MNEPKECPFCGRPPEVVERGGGWTVNCKYHPLYAVMNQESACLVQPFTEMMETPEQAIEIWNTRPVEDKLQKASDDWHARHENLLLVIEKLTGEKPPEGVSLIESREPTKAEIAAGLKLEPLAREWLAQNVAPASPHSHQNGE